MDLRAQNAIDGNNLWRFGEVAVRDRPGVPVVLRLEANVSRCYPASPSFIGRTFMYSGFKVCTWN